MGLEMVKSQVSPEKCEDLSHALPCLILLTWEVIVGPAHTGDARLDSAFKVVAELSVLRRAGEESLVFAVDPGREAGEHLQKVLYLTIISRSVVNSPVLLHRGSETS